jgi:hypothetical protein
MAGQTKQAVFRWYGGGYTVEQWTVAVLRWQKLRNRQKN